MAFRVQQGSNNNTDVRFLISVPVHGLYLQLPKSIRNSPLYVFFRFEENLWRKIIWYDKIFIYLTSDRFTRWVINSIPRQGHARKQSKFKDFLSHFSWCVQALVPWHSINYVKGTLIPKKTIQISSYLEYFRDFYNYIGIKKYCIFWTTTLDLKY